MNKKALLEFYQGRYNVLLELMNDSIDITSIYDTVIHDPYIEQKVDSPVMIIGNSPKIDGEEVPFNGRSKDLLNEIIKKAGLKRESDVITTNAFPFCISEVTKGGHITNRATTSMETLIGSLMLIKEIEIVQPKVIVALGKTAMLALKYINDQEFLDSVEDLDINHFVISKLNCIKNGTVIVGTSHYPDMFNLKNPIKRNELLRFFKRVNVIYNDGFDKLKSHKKNGFVAEYDNYSDIRNYCEEVTKIILSENLLPTPRIYEEYFYKVLAKKNQNVQQNVKNSLLIERKHYQREVFEFKDSVPEDRQYDSLYKIHSKEYFEQELENEIARAEIDDMHLSSVLILKTMNFDDFDEYERIIQEKTMISILKQQTRTDDLITNSDIDTFVVLLKNVSGSIAENVRDRIDQAIKDDDDLNLKISVKLEFITK